MLKPWQLCPGPHQPEMVRDSYVKWHVNQMTSHHMTYYYKICLPYTWLLAFQCSTCKCNIHVHKNDFLCGVQITQKASTKHYRKNWNQHAGNFINKCNLISQQPWSDFTQTYFELNQHVGLWFPRCWEQIMQVHDYHFLLFDYNMHLKY